MSDDDPWWANRERWILTRADGSTDTVLLPDWPLPEEFHPNLEEEPVFEDDPITPEEEAELIALADAARLETGPNILFFTSQAALREARRELETERSHDPARPLHTLTVTLRPGEDGWLIAEVPALPGCITQGRTDEEALANAREASLLWVEHAAELTARR